MSSDQILRYAVTRHFSDFEELADNVRAWDLDFRQLDAGESPAELTQIGFDKIQLTSAHFNRRYDQRGGAPSGTRTFGLLEEGVTGVTWCGRQVTDHTLLMFDASGSFDAVSQPGFKVFTFAVPVETLTNNAEALGVQNPEEVVQVGDHQAVEDVQSRVDLVEAESQASGHGVDPERQPLDQQLAQAQDPRPAVARNHVQVDAIAAFEVGRCEQMSRLVLAVCVNTRLLTDRGPRTM